jgi:demethylmenaquinone methyltransferase/2-methoxy-6-polyprenyl-1,4-benzoquinol methylase
MPVPDPVGKAPPDAPPPGGPRLPPHPILRQHYADEVERRAYLNRLFDAGARHYDWINQVMSFGSGAWYRQRALLRAGLAAGMKVVDVGAGTGLMASRAERIVGSRGSVVALDPSPAMLREARRRDVRRMVQGVGERLPFADNRFDLLCMGYALRHVADLHEAFSEYRRVLKPGGVALLLELAPPASRPFRALLRWYLQRWLPAVTRLGRRSRDAQALVAYYWDTIEQCVPPEAILEALRRAGFDRVGCSVHLGIFAEYTGAKP